ncbi:MAG TPA: helix-turn-helix transcriptional regulator [Streptosporangiaceae bacterium]
MIANPLGAKGITAEAAIAKLCLEGLPALELFERAATPFRRAVPYSAGCWKPLDTRTLLWTGFGIEDGGTGTLAAACWRFIDNELLDADFAKYGDLARRRIPVTTLHRETHGEPDRSPRYRGIHRSLGFGAELRAMFRDSDACWGSVALVRADDQPDFTDNEVAFAARIGAHLAYGLRDALMREAAAGGRIDHAPGVIVLGKDGSVRSLTDQARFWLEQFPHDHGTTLELPAAVHAVASRALAPAESLPAVSHSASIRLASGQWLTVQGAALTGDSPDTEAAAVTLAPSTFAELEPIRLALHGLTPREREVAQLLTRGASNDEIARKLWISRHTVKDHVKAVYAKLGVGCRAELSAKLFHQHIAPRLDSQRIREFSPADS